MTTYCIVRLEELSNFADQVWRFYTPSDEEFKDQRVAREFLRDLSEFLQKNKMEIVVSMAHDHDTGKLLGVENFYSSYFPHVFVEATGMFHRPSTLEGCVLEGCVQGKMKIAPVNRKAYFWIEPR